MKKTIWAKITSEFEGIHKYPNAPDEVAFLRFDHRHIFHVTVWIEQFHNERDVEFIMFKRFIEAAIKSSQFPANASCETMSDFLAEKVIKKYTNRRLKIEITEDGENGAFVEYNG